MAMETCVGTVAHNIPCMNLADDSQTTISALAEGKIAVLDFWTTRCVRCPMAIAKLNSQAGQAVYKDKVVFFTVNCDDADFAKETAEDEEWDNMTNVYITDEVKQVIKDKWGLKNVPHYTMLDATGKIVQNASADSAVKFDFAALEAAAEAFVPGMATPAKNPNIKPLEIEQKQKRSGAATPLEDPEQLAAAARLEDPEQLAAAAREIRRDALAGEGDAGELEALTQQNESLRLRISEISAELMEDEGPGSPGYGTNPLGEVQGESDEPLLIENPSRFVIFPISEQAIWGMYKNVESHFWNAEEIDASQDTAQYATLTPAEQSFVSMLLPSLCLVTDGVLSNLLHRFTQEVQATEARFFFGNEISMLGMHAEMYAMLLESYLGKDNNAGQIAIQEKVAAVPTVNKKHEWCEQWKNSSSSFGHRLVAFACVQSVMNAGAHACIAWLKQRSLLPGLFHAQENISRDLGKYVEFQAMLHSMLVHKVPQDDITRIVKDAVTVEKACMSASGAFDVAAIGMVEAEMAAHIEWSADNLLKMLDMDAVYGTANPYESWLEVAASPRANSGSALQHTQSQAPKEDPTESVLSFGLDDDDF